MSVPVIAEWANFFAVEAESAATLTGLVIVAVSINLGRIIETPRPARSARSRP